MAKRWEGSEVRCAPLNMKCTTKLRAQLEAAARDSGRSLTDEVAYRIERSFLMDDVTRAVREQIRQEMRAEFEARREPTVQWSFQQAPAFMKVEKWPA